MANNSISKYKFGFGLSFVITSFFSALLVVGKETNESLKSFMKEFTGHHWITHGILILVLFVALGFLLSNNKLEEFLKFDTKKMLITIIGGTIISGIIIVGFYLIHI